MVFKNAKWIRADKGCEAPMFRKEFFAEKIEDAEISICGLGFFELYINGKKVSEDLLTPVWSDYEKREFSNMLYPINDSFTYRIYYRQWNVKEYLCEGKNTIGVLLGNGWYNQHERNEEGNLQYGEPKLCYELNIECRDRKINVFSDENDKWAQSSITKTNIFYGETHDARLKQPGWKNNGFDDSSWRKPVILPDPESNLTLQECPADKRIYTLSPKLIKDFSDKKIYDMGENNTAWVKIRAFGKSGESVTVRYAEELYDDYSLNFDSTGKERQIQKDTYICDGEVNEFEPKFVVHAFRYFEITGAAEPVVCTVVHADMPIFSGFKTQDETLSWLYDAYLRTQLSNIHYGVPTDCPHRERLGYTGDGQVTSDTVMLLLDAEKFYEKWIQDIIDGQDLTTGHIQHTAPFYGGGGGPGGWGGAIVFVPYNHYKHYKNKKVLENAYPAMKGWARYLKEHSEDCLVVREEEGGWCLGEWATPEPVQIPEPFINTYFYVKGLECMTEIAKILGKQEDILEYTSYVIKLKDTIVRHYFDEKTGSFCGGIQGSDAFAINIGLGDGRTLENLVQKYKKIKGFDTGIFGVDVLTTVLFEKGYSELCYELITSDNDASFRYQMMHGATTIWEFWSGLDSHNHPMFGAMVKHLFYSILGIKQEKGSYAFEKIVINPCFINALDNVSGYIDTKNGRISVEYIKNEKEVDIKIEIDNRIDATLKIGDNIYKLSLGINQLKVIRE